MKLSLRKANAVQNSINEALRNLKLGTTVTLNEFEDVKGQIQTARDLFWTNTETQHRLMMALYEIRAKVAQANADSGINAHLTNAAYLEKQIAHYTMLVGKGVQQSLMVLTGQLKKLAGSKDDLYGRMAQDVSTSIFTENEISDFRARAAKHKREKQRVQDLLLELNIKTEITLTEETAEFLKKEGIL